MSPLHLLGILLETAAVLLQLPLGSRQLLAILLELKLQGRIVNLQPCVFLDCLLVVVAAAAFEVLFEEVDFELETKVLFVDLF